MSERLQNALVHVFSEALEVPTVGVHDSFFALGGDSLAAVRMLGTVEEVLLAHVPFNDFLEQPTVAGLAELVSRARGMGDSRPSPPRPAPAADGARSGCPPAQERLWFLDQAGAGAAYNLPMSARVRGPLDVEALAGALQDVVGRHEALRTTFTAEDGRPVQVIHPEVDVVLERRDLRAEPDPETAARAAGQAVVDAPFDLQRGPLLRAALLQIREDDHVLVLALHHIICDGWSLAVLFRELGHLYEARRARAPDALPPATQFSEAVRTTARDDVEPGVRWWAERLAGIPPAIELPTDRPRPRAATTAGDTLRFRLDDELLSATRAFARERSTTAYAVLASAYAALLGRLSAQETVVVGTTTSGRGRVGLDDVIGFFANTVSLRVELGHDPEFATLVGETSTVVREALAHDDVPFEWVVAALGEERDASRHPVFQVFFAQAPVPELTVPGAEPFPLSVPGARFEIVLSVEESPDGATLAWEYNEDLFDAATVAALHHRLTVLLAAALQDPAAPVSALALLEPGERAELAAAAAAVAPDQPVACLHERFAAQAEQAPDAPAVVHEGVLLTYRGLEQRANQLAHRLRRAGVGRGTLVALCLERSLDMPVAALAVLKAGGAYVPLDAAIPPERLAFVLSDTAAPVVITQQALRSRFNDHRGIEVIALDADAAALQAEPAGAPPSASEPADLAYVIYTSGSTGQPKGVLVEHRQVARLFSSTQPMFGYGAGDTWLMLHSYAFDFSVWEIWGALLHGGKLVIPSHWTVRSPEALARLLVTERVSVLNATPSLFTGVMDELLAVAAHLAVRLVVFGGEALRPAALRPWFDHYGDAGPRLVNMYGITETTVHVTAQDIGPAAVDRGGSPIGAPLPDLELHLLDGRGEPVPVGFPGEIHVGGAGVARGYLNRPELTDERFVANPFGSGRLYRSGDLARRRPDGVVDFIGRADDQVKIRGYRIELGEVEGALLREDDVAAAAVVTVDRGEGDVRLAAYVVPANSAASDDFPADLLSRVGLRLPAHALPSTIVPVAELPLTVNGKLDRRALPAPVWEETGEREVAAPETPTEVAIAAIWRDVLGVSAVGRDDSFFALGGHSLLAARVTTRVRAELNTSLSVRALFEHPTLRELAEVVETGRAASAPVAPPTAPAPVPDVPRGPHPVGFPQRSLLFLDELHPGVPVYNATIVIEVEGPLDLTALRVALSGVVDRHEPLRTVFAWEDDVPVQVVREPRPVDVDEVDLTDRGADAARAERDRLLVEQGRRRFDLSADLLLRASVFRLGPDRHTLALHTHHVAVDGRSVDVLFADLSALYAAARAGGAGALAPLEATYTDFARGQHAPSGDERAADLEYWRRRLAGARQSPPLVGDRPRPPEQTFAGRTLVETLPADLAERVRTFAGEHATTPYLVLLTAFAALLHRSGGASDILIGTPVANRDDPRFDGLIGFFNNTTVIRAELAGEPTFAELAERLRGLAVEAFDHARVPFDQVVEAVGGRRDPGVNPLFQVNFRARVGDGEGLRLEGARTRWRLADLGIARFDLALDVHVLPEGLRCHLEYNTALFEAVTAQALLADFAALLRDGLDDPEMRLRPLQAARAPEAGIRSFRRRTVGEPPA